MKGSISITLPLKVVLPRKTIKDKSVYINLNTYRNLQHFTSNDVKKIFSGNLKDTLEGVVLHTPIKIIYTYFANSNRKSDLSNMCSILDKFFCDALTTYGCIPDDNYEYVPHVEYIYGGVDKGNGRVVVIIEEGYTNLEGSLNEETSTQKAAINIIKTKKDKEFLESKGITPVGNAKGRKEQLVKYFEGDAV